MRFRSRLHRVGQSHWIKIGRNRKRNRKLQISKAILSLAKGKAQAYSQALWVSSGGPILDARDQ